MGLFLLYIKMGRGNQYIKALQASKYLGCQFWRFPNSIRLRRPIESDHRADAVPLQSDDGSNSMCSHLRLCMIEKGFMCCKQSML